MPVLTFMRLSLSHLKRTDDECFNPIQDGHFPGCLRMGGGALWHLYTLAKEDFKNI